MEVFAAYRSVPDYHAGPAPLKSLHETLDGAIKALYPDREDFRALFRKSHYVADTWIGPDGFGEVKKMEVLP
jgi:hypothetical protein